jgi:hypothetical protein
MLHLPRAFFHTASTPCDRVRCASVVRVSSGRFLLRWLRGPEKGVRGMKRITGNPFISWHFPRNNRFTSAPGNPDSLCKTVRFGKTSAWKECPGRADACLRDHHIETPLRERVVRTRGLRVRVRRVAARKQHKHFSARPATITIRRGRRRCGVRSRAAGEEEMRGADRRDRPVEFTPGRRPCSVFAARGHQAGIV